MNNPSKQLVVAQDAAKIGGKTALTYYDISVEILFKQDGSEVTVADKAAEDKVKKHILSEFSDANFIAEEGGGEFGGDSHWIIDPIDGTKCFTHGIPTWCTLVSYFQNNGFLLGASYFPLTNILIYAEQGKGAYVNDEKVSVSKTKELSKSFVGFTSLKHFENQQLVLNVANMSGTPRSYDSGYMGYLLSTGRIDAIIRGENEKIWDIAPFIPIIEEAGGKITDFKGNPVEKDSKGIIISNGIIHEEIVSIVNINN